VKKFLSLGLAALTCPCHAPLLVVLLAGTALGGWLSQHLFFVFLAMTGVFILSLLYGFGSLSGRSTARKTEGHRASQPEVEQAWRGFET
jgi:mercuric ion transport protein